MYGTMCVSHLLQCLLFASTSICGATCHSRHVREDCVGFGQGGKDVRPGMDGLGRFAFQLPLDRLPAATDKKPVGLPEASGRRKITREVHGSSRR